MTTRLGLLKLFAAALSGVLYALATIYPALFLLTWFAFVPWLWSLINVDLKQSYLLSLLMGFVYCVVSGLAVVQFSVALGGEGLLYQLFLPLIAWFYHAHLFVCIGVCYKLLSGAGYRFQYLIFPLLLALVYVFFPVLFKAHPGETQSLFSIAIQGVSYTGVTGLDVVVGLFNVLLLSLFYPRYWVDKQGKMLIYGVLVIWFGYGVYAQQNWSQQQLQLPSKTFGLVQPNEQATAKIMPPVPGYSRAYPLEMAYSEQLAPYKPDLIVWPESRYKGYYDHIHVAEALAAAVSSLQIPHIFQDVQALTIDRQRQYYNKAVLVDKEGVEQNSYNKMKRVPIGEHYPLFPELAKKYLGKTMKTIIAGTKAAVFVVDDMHIIPLICYEVMFSEFVAGRATEGNVLLAISNDSWFAGSRLPYQHMAASSLRAVENRMPLIHLINNGPSVVVLSDGTIAFQSTAQQAAAYIVEVPYNTEITSTFYNRYPLLMRNLLLAVLLLLVASQLSSSKPVRSSYQS